MELVMAVVVSGTIVLTATFVCAMTTMCLACVLNLQTFRSQLPVDDLDVAI